MPPKERGGATARKRGATAANRGRNQGVTPPGSKERTTGGRAQAQASSTPPQPVFPSTPPRTAQNARPPTHYEEIDLSNVSPSSDDEDPGSGPPVLVSPIKSRQRKAAPAVVRLSDIDVWDMTDEEIIEASRLIWRSEVYDHYDISLIRETVDTEEGPVPNRMVYQFTCKDCPDTHPPHFRPRQEGAKSGTSNLRNGMMSCLARQGLEIENQKAETATISYSEAAHRTLIAIRCARHKRPFNFVVDEEYQLEVEMLRPGTKLPHPSTISNDVQKLYQNISIDIKSYFQQLTSAIHLVLDGWTAPIVASYFGIVIVWVTNGKIHRQILEFIRLTKKHDGNYLAKIVADCVKRFGLEKLLFCLCMDNASNCDRLAVDLPKYLPLFRGIAARARCFPHIVNLIAKIFLSFFFKRPKTKKTIKVPATTTTQAPLRGRGGTARAPLETDTAMEMEEVVIEIGDADEDDDDNTAAVEAVLEEDEEEDDDGKVTHDREAVRSMRQQAINNMEDLGLMITMEEQKKAMQLFPRVAGLARRVHDSPTLNEEFQKLVEKDDELQGGMRTLTRRVATRWNSDFDCLKSHLHFRHVVEQLTGNSRLGLKAYQLNADQWELAQRLCDILVIFKEVTELFSQKEVPLIIDVIPTLLQMKNNLTLVRDDADDLCIDSPIVRVAAEASLLMIEKYFLLTSETEIYFISIVMCPDRKLKWFRNKGLNVEEAKIKKMVNQCFKDRYAQYATPGSRVREEPQRQSRARAAQRDPGPWNFQLGSQEESAKPLDSMERYLADSQEMSQSIIDSGGYIAYWTNALEARPALARMGLDFCSIPASSVDAERAFSSGRLQVNHLQHNMSSQTFKAQVALGSYATSDAWPGFDRAVEILKH